MSNFTNICLNKPNINIHDNDITDLISSNIDTDDSKSVHERDYAQTSSQSHHKVKTLIYDKDQLLKHYPTKEQLFKELGYEDLSDDEIHYNSSFIMNAIKKRGINYTYDCLIMLAYDMKWIIPSHNSSTSPIISPIISSTTSSITPTRQIRTGSKIIPKNQSHLTRQFSTPTLTNLPQNVQQNKRYSEKQGKSEKRSESEKQSEYNEQDIINEEIKKGEDTCTML